MLCVVQFYFFFFQAEDGIRDSSVTGVQTCALPISAALVPARHFGVDRIEIWLRRWTVRRMYGPREWASDAILRDGHARRCRKRSHHDRRPRQERIASRSESLDADQRAAMWLLPGGADHAGRGVIEQQKETYRPRDRRGHVREHLPLRNVSADSRSD